MPGVPPLASYGSGIFPFLTNDLIGNVAALFESQWGIFLNGIPVLIAADNMVSFEHRQDHAISDYPVENGGFQSYNKVGLPQEVRVRMSCGGSEIDRQAFLASIDLVMNNTFLYDVVTPEKVYLDYNFSHRDLRRTASSGAGLLTVDLWLTEIRVSSTATFTSTSQPGEAGGQALGNVQPAAPSEAVTTRVTSATVQ